MDYHSREIEKIKTPEEKELDKKREILKRLEYQLADKELNLSTLMTELHYFELKYLKIVGCRYAELDEIEAKIAELLAKKRPEDFGLRDRADEARSRANKSSSEINEEVISFNETTKFNPPEQIRKLYREIAKRVHPDLATDSSDHERRNGYMSDAIQAYQEGNESRLQQILEDWESSPESIEGDGIGNDLVRIIRKIDKAEKRVLEIDTEIQELKKSEIYQILSEVQKAEEENRNLLDEMATKLDRDIERAKIRLSVLEKE